MTCIKGSNKNMKLTQFFRKPEADHAIKQIKTCTTLKTKVMYNYIN